MGKLQNVPITVYVDRKTGAGKVVARWSRSAIAICGCMRTINLIYNNNMSTLLKINVTTPRFTARFTSRSLDTRMRRQPHTPDTRLTSYTPYGDDFIHTIRRYAYMVIIETGV